MKITIIGTALLFCAATARGQTVKKDTTKAAPATTAKRDSSGKTSAKKAEPKKYSEFSPETPTQQAKPAASAAEKYQEFTPSNRDSAAKRPSAKAPAKPTHPAGDTTPAKKP